MNWVGMLWMSHNSNLPSWLTKTVQLAVSICTHCKCMWDTCRTGEWVDPCHLVGLEVEECELKVAPLERVPMDLSSLKMSNMQVKSHDMKGGYSCSIHIHADLTLPNSSVLCSNRRRKAPLDKAGDTIFISSKDVKMSMENTVSPWTVAGQ